MSKSSLTKRLIFMRCKSWYSVVFSLAGRLVTNVCSDETGEMLGEHIWDADMLRETRGLFMMLAVSPFAMRTSFATSEPHSDPTLTALRVI